MSTPQQPHQAVFDPNHASPLVGVVMGSRSDYDIMQATVDTLTEFGIPHETNIVSAHRTPLWMVEYATSAKARGLQLMIAAAGGAAHLPGMIAALSPLPVLGVPIAATSLQGMDALLSIVQMPAGVPVGTLAIGRAGAINAAWLAAQILALHDPALQARVQAKRQQQTDAVQTNHTL